MKKYWKKILLIILGFILVLGLLNFNKIKRLSIVLGLFKPENITENFLTMEDIFYTNKIEKSSQPTTFYRKDFVLPASFDFGDTTWNVNDYLEYSQTTGLLILKNDTILYESYLKGYSEQEDHISWSVSKSIVSAMIGIAIQKGEINSIYDPVDKYAPLLSYSGYSGVPIKDVLQMSSGIAFNEDYHDFYSDINKLGRVFALGRSFDNYVQSLKSEGQSGKYHKYVSMDTQVLGMVLKGATGKTLSEYLEINLWKPMGAEAPAYWLKDNKGMEAAFGGLNCSLRDYGRFGLLYANLGYSNGQQIIDSSWVIKSTTATESHLLPGEDNPYSNSSFGYGYQWWIPDLDQQEFMAIGVYSQFIFVDKKSKLIIVKNSANYHYAEEQKETVKRHLAFFRSIKSALNN